MPWTIHREFMSQLSTNSDLTLWEWVTRHGGSAPKARLSDAYPRTVIAAENVNGAQDGGDTIFSIPITCLMTPAAAFADVTYGKVFELFAARQSVEDRTVLVFFLAIERQRGMTSHWGPYIRELPSIFSNPLNWSRAETLRLAGTRLGGATKFHDCALLQLTEVCVPAFIAILRAQLILSANTKAIASGAISLAQDALSPDRLAWSHSCVSSRAFSLFLNGQRTIALVPLGDMLDHSPDAQIEWRTDDTAGQFSIISHDRLPAGSIMFNNYGAKSNEELILGYGFFMKSSVLETLYVRLAVDDMNEMRCRDNRGYDCDHMSITSGDIGENFLSRRLAHGHYLSTRSPVPPTFLTSSRILMMSPTELYTWRCRTCEGSDESQLKTKVGFNQHDRATFRILQQLVGLLRKTSKHISRYKRLAPKHQNHINENVRCLVAWITKEYRYSQLEIAHAVLRSLRLHCSELMHNCDAVKEAGAVDNCSAFITTRSDPSGAWEEINTVYREWECNIGVEKISAALLPFLSHQGQIQHGLRVSIPITHGDIIGRVPTCALLVASHALNEICVGVNSDEQEEVALAVALMLCAINESNAFNPFAKWLLCLQSATTFVEAEVLDNSLDVACGNEATCFRKQYDGELNFLKSAGLPLHNVDESGLDFLYSKARLVVSKQALRLPRAAETLEPSVSGHLALVPFLGFFPRAFHFSIGTFRWAYGRNERYLPDEYRGGWHLELSSSCDLTVDTCFVTPLAECSSASPESDVTRSALTLPEPIKPNMKIPLKTSLGDDQKLILEGLLQSWKSHELCFQLADTDEQLRHRKEDLLRITGLGSIHHVTLIPSPARLCAALGICATNRSAIFHETDICLKSCADAMIFGSESLNLAHSTEKPPDCQRDSTATGYQYDHSCEPYKSSPTLLATTLISRDASSNEAMPKAESELVFSSKVLMNLSNKNVSRILRNLLRRLLLYPNSKDSPPFRKNVLEFWRKDFGKW